MPFNRTIQVIIKPAEHALGDAEKEASRYSIGDAVATFDPSRFATFNIATNEWLMQSQMGNPTFAYVHVKNIPDTLTIQGTQYNFTPEIFDSIVMQEYNDIVNSASTVSTVTGSFTANGAITFTPSGATATFKKIENGIMDYVVLTGTPTANDTITDDVLDGMAFLVNVEPDNTKVIRRRGMRVPLEKLPNTFRKHKILGTAPQVRANNTAYDADACVQLVQNSEFVYQCTTAGISDGVEFTPPANYWDTVTDGTCVWKAIRNDRQISINWAVFKKFARRKNAINKLNRLTDDEGASNGLDKVATLNKFKNMVARQQ